MKSAFLRELIAGIAIFALAFFLALSIQPSGANPGSHLHPHKSYSLVQSELTPEEYCTIGVAWTVRAFQMARQGHPFELLIAEIGAQDYTKEQRVDYLASAYAIYHRFPGDADMEAFADTMREGCTEKRTENMEARGVFNM